jgi:hypothetical protein
MPKPTTYPIIIDSLRSISVKTLTRKTLLQIGTCKKGEITWSDRFTKEVTNSVGIEINTTGNNSFIRLNYSIGEKDYNYPIQLTRLPSNLGKGFIWHFLCPVENNRCTKLFLLEDQFVGRAAVVKTGAMYASEIREKGFRQMDKDSKRKARLIDTVLEGHKRYRKSTYRGIPTKRKLKIIKAGIQLRKMMVIGREPELT